MSDYNSIKNQGIETPIEEILLKIADNNFKVFRLCSEDDIDLLRSSYLDKDKLQEHIKNMLEIEVASITTKQLTKAELFCLLTEFLFNQCEDISNIEVCTIYVIFHSTLNHSFKKFSKKQIFEYFKKEVIRHSLDRPPYQIGILSKKTIEKLSEFFIEKVYMRFEFLSYMMTKRQNMEIVNKDMFMATLPHILDLSMGTEFLPRHSKILKQYTENRKPKSELEQKIEMILEFERLKLDQILEDKFLQQDQVFNKKVEELISKKKK